MAALGARYANDKRLGSVDVGGYGKYGEWWVDYPHDEDHRRQRAADGRGRQQGLPDQDHPVQHDDLGRPHPQGAGDEPRMGMRTDSLGAPT